MPRTRTISRRSVCGLCRARLVDRRADDGACRAYEGKAGAEPRADFRHRHRRQGQRGFFEKRGLDISVSNFTSGKQCLDTVVGGGADIATTAEAPVTAAAMAGQPIAFLARMEYSDLKTVVATKAGIKDKAGLKGKKIAFTAGTGSEVYTVALLKAAGLKKDDVTLVNLRPQEMLPALLPAASTHSIPGSRISPTPGRRWALTSPRSTPRGSIPRPSTSW